MQKMKGIRYSMFYQYFDSQEAQIQAEIDFYEKRLAKNLSYEDLKKLEQLRIQKETIRKVFRDLCSFAVEII